MEKRNFYNEYDASKTYLWALLLPQVVSFVVAMIFSYIFKTPEEMANSLSYLFVACVLSQVCFIFIIFYYNKKNKINFIKASRLNFKFSIRNLIGVMAIAVIAVFGFVNLISWLNSLLESIGFDVSGLSLPLNSFGWLIINVILLAVIPAICEECIFRGMIFSGLRKKGVWFAGIISALMFAFVHLSMAQFIFPIIMGLVLAFVYEKTKSLLYTIICHICNNFIVLLISYISTITERNIVGINVTNIASAVIVIAIAIVAAISIILIIKYVLRPVRSETKQSENQESITPVDNEDANSLIEKKTKNLYIYGSLLVGVVLWLIMIIYGIML